MALVPIEGWYSTTSNANANTDIDIDIDIDINIDIDIDINIDVDIDASTEVNDKYVNDHDRSRTVTPTAFIRDRNRTATPPAFCDNGTSDAPQVTKYDELQYATLVVDVDALHGRWVLHRARMADEDYRRERFAAFHRMAPGRVSATPRHRSFTTLTHFEGDEFWPLHIRFDFLRGLMAEYEEYRFAFLQSLWDKAEEKRVSTTDSNLQHQC